MLLKYFQLFEHFEPFGQEQYAPLGLLRCILLLVVCGFFVGLTNYGNYVMISKEG